MKKTRYQFFEYACSVKNMHMYFCDNWPLKTPFFAFKCDDHSLNSWTFKTSFEVEKLKTSQKGRISALKIKLAKTYIEFASRSSK
jgi:hypothetical protein